MSCDFMLLGIGWMEERIRGWPAAGDREVWHRKDLVVSTPSVLCLVVIVGTAWKGCVVASASGIDRGVVSASSGIDWCIVAAATEDRHAGLGFGGCEGSHYVCSRVVR
jgi:hypothetical protein